MTSTQVIDELRAKGAFAGLGVELRRQMWLNDCDAPTQYSEDAFFVMRISGEEVTLTVEEGRWLAKWLQRQAYLLAEAEAMVLR